MPGTATRTWAPAGWKFSSRRRRKIRIKLDFFAPFKANNIAEFTFTPQGDATNVEWVMTGENIFFGKLMSVFMDFDKMIGKDFEAGLADMKAAAERG